jgi:hypothetical protein
VFLGVLADALGQQPPSLNAMHRRGHGPEWGWWPAPNHQRAIKAWDMLRRVTLYAPPSSNRELLDEVLVRTVRLLPRPGFLTISRC